LRSHPNFNSKQTLHFFTLELACATISCNQNSIYAELPAKVFGFGRSDKKKFQAGIKKLRANGQKCSDIIYDLERDVFIIQSDLEACNMTRDIIYENSEKFWNFQHRIQRAAEYLGAVSYNL
jgi:hypothetical protein